MRHDDLKELEGAPGFVECRSGRSERYFAAVNGSREGLGSKEIRETNMSVRMPSGGCQRTEAGLAGSETASLFVFQ